MRYPNRVARGMGTLTKIMVGVGSEIGSSEGYLDFGTAKGGLYGGGH